MISRVGADGRYVLMRIIGRGAMGVVYLAKDTLIEREVALKTFSFSMTAENEEFRSRFLREAQTAGRLSHANVVTIHDVFEEGGAPFIAMEYVDGVNIQTLMQRRGRLDPELAASVAAKVAGALDYAHSRGVIHRDIKPANIILTAQNEPKITDFGIARLHQASQPSSDLLLGTPNYMAPEQISSQPYDQRADLFSLGVVLFEMMTGERPFTGDNLVAVARRIVEQPAPLATSVVGTVPPQLSMVIEKLLEKDPELRYSRGDEVRKDLALAVRGAPPEELLANREGDDTLPLHSLLAAKERSEARRRRWRRILTVATTTAAAALLAAAGLFWGWTQAIAGDTEWSRELERRSEAAPHFIEGARLYRQGELDAARMAFERALTLAPDQEKIQRWHQRVSEEVRVAAAAAAAQAEALARTELPAGESAPVPLPPPKASLDIAVFSEIPAGTLRVYKGSQEIFRRQFSFWPEGGRMTRWLPWKRPKSGQLNATRQVTTGAADLRVVLLRRGEDPIEARVRGRLRTEDRALLDIRISRKGELDVEMEYR